ncbi:MAG TPA: peptidase C1 [Verrucomicrobiota bacterium]|nr:peptidase C1 [Verrucomicrobiota bacterium]HNU51141.1 peptidase C1 [Verrucomicrobiota bacterium]
MNPLSFSSRDAAATPIASFSRRRIEAVSRAIASLTATLAVVGIVASLRAQSNPAPAGSGATTPSDTAVYREMPPIEREIQEENARDQARAERKGLPFTAESRKPKKKLTMDFSTLVRPRSLGEFQPIWHQPPKRQWWTGNCWCFCTTSLMESEIHRLTGKEIKLSEMFTVYWEFVEKAREYVRTKGTSLVAEGSQSEALLLRWKTCGIVPESAYTGLRGTNTVFDQGPLMDELSGYLGYVKNQQLWDESIVLPSVRLILNRHLGEPPARITVDGRTMTPQEYLRDVVRLNPDDYVEFMSFLYAPFWTKAEYEVPDNYWHSKEYYNVPLEEWYGALTKAVQAGFSVTIAGDVSEIGHEGAEDVALVPSFDMPPERIDQSAREFRFANQTTGDDHGLHVVGCSRLADHDWFLIKDSSRSGQRGIPGYWFYRGDYLRLKMLTFRVHKDAVRDLLTRFASENAKINRRPE